MCIGVLDSIHTMDIVSKSPNSRLDTVMKVDFATRYSTTVFLIFCGVTLYSSGNDVMVVKTKRKFNRQNH